jgi:hypothetical protein
LRGLDYTLARPLGITTDCREKGSAFKGDIARKLGMG